ncbi:hypothetical protein D8834_00815 [Streptococcus oralis]|nr:hypothetical protein D8834_00815 [Streptococcus oralis]
MDTSYLSSIAHPQGLVIAEPGGAHGEIRQDGKRR